jgi:putative PIN family toxin of toxin-antitoxin system
VRVLLDTSVLASALVLPGSTAEAVYRLALEGRIELVTSRPLLAELGRVLIGSLGWDASHTEEAVRQILRIGLVVEPRETVRAVAADPADARAFEAALAGDADAIVSSDKHLLGLGNRLSTRIVDPATFLAGP